MPHSIQPVCLETNVGPLHHDRWSGGTDNNYRRMVCHKEVFSPQLFNIYTNDQPVHDETRSFIYAYDLCITVQYPTFSQVDNTIKEALEELIEYYRNNSLCANPHNTQVTAFHLRNRGKNITESVMELS